MRDAEKAASLFSRLRHQSWFLMAVWTGCIAASVLWNLHEQRNKIHNMARNAAQIRFENDVLYRTWAARHGGVYVPVSEYTPPNPHLKVPDRDVTTSSGLSLTLVNPAYMARQVNELAVKAQGSRAHITSLRPIRPENQPDAWEAAALAAFEAGEKEVTSFVRAGDEEYLRFMRPFVTEKACLKCHAAQGYQEGDIRGGISVSIPTAPLWAIERPHIMRISVVHVGLWMIGIAGILISRVSLARQIGAREQADSALRRTAEDLARSNKELERFAYLASHDLQEPLRMVTSFVGLLRSRYQDRLDVQANEYMGYVAEGASRMKQLIDDLLAYSRVDRPGRQLGPIDTEASLEAALGNLRVSIAESGAAVTHDPLPTIPAEPGQLTQLFQNLIGNAIKFRRPDVRPEIHVGAKQDTDHWVFWVRDNGIGIAPEHHERIFTIFERLHLRSEYPGNGVGLAICKKIVEHHGGRIWVESEAGTGSTFYFTMASGA